MNGNIGTTEQAPNPYTSKGNRMNFNGYRPTLLMVAFALLIAFFMALTPVSVKADNPNNSLFPPTSHPYGDSYSERTQAWWEWALPIPTPDNPLLQSGDVDCSAAQSGRVWYLAGTGVGPVVRNCEIPQGTALMFPIINLIAWRPGDFTTEQEGRDLLAMLMDTTENLELVIDGESVTNLDLYRYQSPLFEMTVPADNIFGIGEPLTRDFITDGYWVMLKPLPPGEHTIEFYGEVTHPWIPFNQDVTYHITVTD